MKTPKKKRKSIQTGGSQNPIFGHDQKSTFFACQQKTVQPFFKQNAIEAKTTRDTGVEGAQEESTLREDVPQKNSINAVHPAFPSKSDYHVGCNCPASQSPQLKPELEAGHTIDESPAKILRKEDEKGESTEDRFEISRGVMQMAIEGNLAGNKYDVRKPHMPESLGQFAPASKKDKKGKGPFYKKDSNDRFAESRSGSYKKVIDLSIYQLSDYDRTVPDGNVIGTYANNSGLTIGYGYDLGRRTKDEVESRMKDAGLPEKDASTIASAAGLRGVKAGEKTAKIRNAGFMITKEQVLKLLDLTIGEYEEGIDKDAYHAVVVEIMVYLNYWRGSDGAKKYVDAIKKACEGKEKSEQIAATKTVIDKYTGGSKPDDEKTWNQKVFTRFSLLLKELIAQQAGGKEIVVSDKVKTRKELLKDKDKTGELIEKALGRDYDKELKKEQIIRMNVGFGSPNDKQDVEAVMTRILKHGDITQTEYDEVMKTLEEKHIGEYVKRFQISVKLGSKDGVVTVGHGTEQALIKVMPPTERKPEKYPDGEKDKDKKNSGKDLGGKRWKRQICR